MSEAAIQTEIMSWLRSKNIYFWRVPLGPVKHGGIRKKNPMAGHCDLAGIIPNTQGRMFAIEVKYKTKLSEIQKEVIGKLEKSGVLVIVATSLLDVTSLLDKT